jgi:sortase A
VRRVVAGTGKVLITVGILILLFVAYQLWGTGIYTARQQNKLENQFEQALGSTGSDKAPNFPTASTKPTGPTTATTVPVTTTTEPPIDPIDPSSDAVAHIVIPKIGVDWIVVQGVSLDDLRSGPGHYPSTPFPGQLGNAAIAGHRTTYGAPFNKIPDLEPGDVINIRTLQGQFEYVVYDGFPVSPDDVSVLDADPKRPATLTLTTCHPEYQAAQRYIIKAELKLPPNAAPLPSTVDPSDPKVSSGLAGEGLSGESGSKLPTLLTGLLMLLVGLLWWWFFHRHPRWTTWFIGVIPFAITLAIFYFYLERALPANY